ncbi:MAG: hypothetical protein HKP24_06410 [Croceitalea sp.]|nr:hypothetical protein [Croceitalea sp.]
MLLKKTDIESRLNRLKNRDKSPEQILQEVYKVLHQDSQREEEIEKRLTQKSISDTNKFTFDLLKSERIYHLDQIKDICIDYRLRFLDSKYFKGKIPQAGISKIKHLESQHGIEIKGFKIMAPSKLFKLEDKDDPLLFAPIGNGYYYLIHKWGNDLHPLRKILVWPFKGMVNLTITTLIISYLATLLVPTGIFRKTNTSAEFWMVFFFMFKSIAAIVIFYGFALGKNFNPAIWNSKYFNA